MLEGNTVLTGSSVKTTTEYRSSTVPLSVRKDSPLDLCAPGFPELGQSTSYVAMSVEPHSGQASVRASTVVPHWRHSKYKVDPPESDPIKPMVIAMQGRQK